MQYNIYYNQETAHKHFVSIDVAFNTADKDTLVVKLPTWRPGRYELGNFAKNLKDFEVVDKKGNNLQFAKRSKHEWLVHSHDVDEVIVKYLYFANELNAGASFMDETQLYINPVNCLVYEEFKESDSCELNLHIPEEFEVVISMDKIGKNSFKASSFHELVDSPFIASNSLQHNSYSSHDVKFHLWFQGEVKPDWDKLITDFKRFTDYQIEQFGAFPVEEYHFIFQIDTKKAYHGVEHQKNTVIYLGPSYMVFNKLYTELLGVSSHELYHTWNVKAIRPEEMHPYDYSQENYSRLGYVAEGVTTYMGDRILLESGVFDDVQYHKEIGNYITRHLHNDGRKHLSVADSSFDTWLDGYVAGIPGRKTSIYVEGALIAYICDMRIREATDGSKSLHDAMQMLYNISRGMGYSDATYQEVLEVTSGESFEDIFDQLIYGTEDYMPFLERAMSYDGRKLELLPASDLAFSYGMKGGYVSDGYKLTHVLEGSSADETGLIPGDIIHAVNGVSLDKNLSEWLLYFQEDEIAVQLIRDNQLKRVTLAKCNGVAFKKISVSLT